MKIVKLVVSVLIVVAISCKDNITSPILSDDDRVREAVFRYQFGLTGYDSLILFIGIVVTDSINGQISYGDPSKELISKFNTHKPPVKPYSASYPRNAGFYDNETNTYGIRFHVESIQWQSSTQVQVSGGYIVSVDNAEKRWFFLHATNNLWMVDSTRIISIS